MASEGALNSGSTGLRTASICLVLALAACRPADAGPHAPGSIERRSAAASAPERITYHGGGVLAAAEVVVVVWGTNVPVEVVERTVATYQTLAELNDFDWISEYDTDSQHIRRPTYLGEVVIDPGDAGTRLPDAGTKLNELDIVSELVMQLDAGVLPPATADRYYAVYFPPGVMIVTGIFEDRSCHEWVAYHGDLAPGEPGTYAVFPACGQNSPNAVHELFEAVTDPHDNDGWTTDTGFEIADLCSTFHSALPLPDGGTLDIQKLWSDVTGTCLGSGNDFNLSIDPQSATVAPEISFTVSMNPPRNPYTQLSWNVSGLPDGGTFRVSPEGGPDRWTLVLDVPQVEAFFFTVEAQTELRSASAGANVSRAPAAPAGCSQAGGSAWPLGLLAALGLGSLGLRRRP